MGKKKSNSANAARALESTISPMLEMKYSDPLFSVASHPTKPIFLSGLATGHVYCTKYDDIALEESQVTKREENELLEKEAFAKGKISAITKSVSQTQPLKKWWTVVADHSTMEQSSSDEIRVSNMWKTKRHKGSCRSVIFDPLENSVGESIFTVGTDHIIKKADTETGKVTSKAAIDFGNGVSDAVTKLCHSATHQFLLAGTENGTVMVYDSSNLGNSLKFTVDKVHDDSINHLLAMPLVSAYHYLSLGSTTLSHIDIRKGVITQSDDQEDELLSMCYGGEGNDTVLVSHGEGIVTIWKQSKNSLMDQLSRIKVNKSASIDAIIPTMNMDNDELANSVWCGDSEGLLHRINFKMGKVVETRVHSSATKKHGAADEVGVLEIDYNYRLISAGMDSLKIWSNEEYKGGDDDDSGWEDSDSDDGKDDGENGADNDDDSASDASGLDSDIDCDSDASDLGPSDFSDSDEEEPQQDEKDKEDDVKPRKVPVFNSKPNKKKLVNLNKPVTADKDEEPQTKKAKQMTTKQLRNLQKHEHGIRRFDDL